MHEKGKAESRPRNVFDAEQQVGAGEGWMELAGKKEGKEKQKNGMQEEAKRVAGQKAKEKWAGEGRTDGGVGFVDAGTPTHLRHRNANPGPSSRSNNYVNAAMQKKSGRRSVLGPGN